MVKKSEEVGARKGCGTKHAVRNETFHCRSKCYLFIVLEFHTLALFCELFRLGVDEEQVQRVGK